MKFRFSVRLPVLCIVALLVVTACDFGGAPSSAATATPAASGPITAAPPSPLWSDCPLAR
jgi:hypothetical protein